MDSSSESHLSKTLKVNFGFNNNYWFNNKYYNKSSITYQIWLPKYKIVDYKSRLDYQFILVPLKIDPYFVK